MSQPSKFREVQAALRDHLAGPSALKSIGYDYVHLGGWWEPTATNVDADVSLRYQGSTEFLSAVWGTTMLSLFWPPVYGGTGPDGETMPFVELARDGALYAFDAPGGHRPATRSRPSCSRTSCSPTRRTSSTPTAASWTDDTVTHRPERVNYVEQLQWTNRRVLQAIDRLMAHDPDEPDPIIILQADEGPFPPAFSANERGFQWLDASPREIQQKFGILNAVRLPGVDPASARIQRREQPGQPVPDGVRRLLRRRPAAAAERDLPVARLLADVGLRAVPAPGRLAGAELCLHRSGQRLQRQRAVAQHRIVEGPHVEGGAQPSL